MAAESSCPSHVGNAGLGGVPPLALRAWKSQQIWRVAIRLTGRRRTRNEENMRQANVSVHSMALPYARWPLVENTGYEFARYWL